MTTRPNFPARARLASLGPVALGLALGLCAGVSAQVSHCPAPPFNGDAAGDLFGRSVSGAGDVNNDGFADVIVGAPSDDNNGSSSGSARIFSGRSGAILYTFNGDSAEDQFGASVRGAGDVNNDGFADVIVGALLDDNNGPSSGSARVFSGATGAVLFAFNGDSASDFFGGSVGGAGDVNNDGFDDLIVGAVFGGDNDSNSGSARVFSGSTGTILYTFNGDSTGDYFGASVGGAGDVNNDGFDDLVVGAPFDDNNGTDSGSARVFSGRNGTVLYSFNGAFTGYNFGSSVSGAGDVNNDGFDDIIIGTPLSDTNFANSGSAQVFSGRNGAVLHSFNGAFQGENLGVSVSGAGDVNHDGFADVIVGAQVDNNNGPSSGSARVFSGATGAILSTFNGDSPGDQFGVSVSGAGDVNNDGFDDLIVGAFLDDNNGTDSGSARLFYSSIPFGWATAPVPCTGDANFSGVVDFQDVVTVLTNFNLVCP